METKSLLACQRYLTRHQQLKIKMPPSPPSISHVPLEDPKRFINANELSLGKGTFNYYESSWADRGMEEKRNKVVLSRAQAVILPQRREQPSRATSRRCEGDGDTDMELLGPYHAWSSF